MQSLLNQQAYHFIIVMNNFQMNDRTQSNASALLDAAPNPYTPSMPNPNPYQTTDFQPVKYPMAVDQDIRASFGADRNKLQATGSSKHVSSLIATILLAAGLTTGSVLFSTRPGTLTVGEFIAIIISSYILYLIIACACNDLYSYLSHVDHGLQFQQHYNQIRGLVGHFKLYAECYHNQLRVHTTFSRDKDGNEHVNTYTTNEKVITHTATELITPATTEDISGEADRIRAEKEIVFINFLVNYRFKTDQCRMRLDQLYHIFRENNRRDQFQNYSMNYEVPGLVEKQCFYVGQLGCDYRKWFILFAAVGLVWPYSLWVQAKVDRFNIALTKQLTF